MSDQPSAMRLYDTGGRRLYLTPSERQRFILAAASQTDDVYSLCLCLAFTGCRISEALALRPSDLQIEESLLSIHSLKKRKPGHVREIPIPDELVTFLTFLVEGNRRYWPIARATAWRQVKTVMHEAEISGPHAMPKGLRHAFAVNAILKNVPPMILQKWMGHASLSTTAIYTQVSGPEERVIAQRMWG